MDLSQAMWRKSSRSNSGGNCVEVALTGTVVGVRDTKNRPGGYFTADAQQWAAFLSGIKAGRFDG